MKVTAMEYPTQKYPPHLDMTSALVLERVRVELNHPQIEALWKDALKHLELAGNYKPLPASVGVLVDTAYLRSLLENHWEAMDIRADDVAPDTLVLYLPPAFNWAAREMAKQSPEVFNSPQLDLRDNATYLGWNARIAAENQITTVQVEQLSGMVDAVNHAYRYPTHEWGWMPVVIVAGDTVAVGGFVVDEVLLGGLQGASMSTQSCMPEEIYSSEELRIASERAAKHGLKPWVKNRWQGDGGWRLEPIVLVSHPR